MKHNSRTSMSHNVEYLNFRSDKNLYRFSSPSNPDLSVIRDYLQLFQNRSADFDEIKIVCTKRGITDYFMLQRTEDFSQSSLSIVRYDGLDIKGFVSSFEDPSVSEISRVCYSRLRAHLINDWLLDSVYVFSAGGQDYSHDFNFERSSDRS